MIKDDYCAVIKQQTCSVKFTRLLEVLRKAALFAKSKRQLLILKLQFQNRLGVIFQS